MMQGDQTERSVLKAMDALCKINVELIVVASVAAARPIATIWKTKPSPGRSQLAQFRYGQGLAMRSTRAYWIILPTNPSRHQRQ